MRTRERKMLIAKGDYENTRMCEDANGTEWMAPETYMQQAHRSEKRTRQQYICSCLHMKAQKYLFLCFFSMCSPGEVLVLVPNTFTISYLMGLFDCYRHQHLRHLWFQANQSNSGWHMLTSSVVSTRSVTGFKCACVAYFWIYILHEYD